MLVKIMKQENIKLIGALTSKPYAFSARSWELENLDFVDFYDSLLSNISIDLRGLSVMRVLPRINEQLNEEWISDKIRFSYDGFRRQRLLSPMIKNMDLKTYEEVSWEEAFFNFYLNLSLVYFDYISIGQKVDKVLEIIYGKFLDLESLNSSKTFFKNFNNLKTISNFQEGGYSFNDFNFNYLSSLKISEMNLVDFFFLINSNIRYENPILNLKISRSANQGSYVFSFGCPSNIRIKTYSLGNSLSNFINFLKGKSKYSLILSKSKKSLVIIGQSLRQRLDFSNFFNLLKVWNKNLHLMFTYVNPSFIGSLALGLSSNNSVNSSMNSVGNMLYLYNADDIFIKDTKKYKYIVYQGHHGDYGASISNLILPSTFLLEKKGTFLNMEGYVVNYNFIIKPGHLVRTDWRIFSALSLFLKKSIKSNLFNTFNDVIVSFSDILPEYIKKRLSMINYNNINNFNNINVKFYNSVFYSNYIEYFLSDSISRASRVMSVAASKFKNYFFNF